MHPEHCDCDRHGLDNDKNTTSSCGIIVVIVFFFVHLLLVMAPAISYWNYDFVSNTLHLEEPRVFTDEAVVQTNRAIGLTNLIWVIPLNTVAILGWLPVLCQCNTCCKRRNADEQRSTSTLLQPPIWVFTVSYMLLGVAMYWPIQFLSSRLTYSSADIDHVHLQESDVITLILVLAMGMWSTWYLTSFYHDVIASTTKGNNIIRSEEVRPIYGSVD